MLKKTTYSALALMLLLFVGCEKTRDKTEEDAEPVIIEEVQVEKVETISPAEKQKDFQDMYNEPMQDLVTYILEKKDIAFDVYEEEKGYYVGFVRFNKNMEFIAGYEAAVPIVINVDSYSFEEDRMIIVLSKSLVRENNGEKELYFTGILEAVITRDELFSYYKPLFEGIALKAPLSVKAKITKEPQ